MRAIVIVSVAALGCGAAATPQIVPATPTYSSLSAGAVVTPRQPERDGDLVVRPDLLTVSFAVDASGKDAAEAEALARARVDEIARRVRAATGGAATVKPCDFRVTDARDRRTVTVDGSIEVPLPPDADYWARAHLYAAVKEVCAGFERDARDLGWQPGFTTPVATLRDADAHRDALVRRWVERARAFAAAAQSPAAPLALVDCQPPATVAQRTVSLEEVALSLPLTCRLGSSAR